jgi:hypothetical protein
MIVRDNLPFSFIERKVFLNFLNIVTPLYKPPCRRTITALIDNRFEKLSTIFKGKIKDYDSLCVTMDMWTETHQTLSYLGVTVRFKEDDAMQGCTIGVHQFDDKHTSVNIGEKLIKVLNEWNIDSKQILAVVTDNAANIVKSVYDTLGVQKHIRCFAHTLNLAVENSIKANAFISSLIEKNKKVVTWFKQQKLN